MTWHFPHGSAKESTIRIGDYKLIRNYDHVLNEQTPELELFQLYETKGNKQHRVDIEEAKNLASAMPERTAEMNRELTRRLTEMKASYPSYNPNCDVDLPGKEKVCTVLTDQRDGNNVQFTYRENGAKVVRADLLYTLNGGDRYEEWFRKPAKLNSEMTVSAELPQGTTHYLVNLIDENNFLRSYPEVDRKGKPSASALAMHWRPMQNLPVQHRQKGTKRRGRKSRGMTKANQRVSIAEKDTNKDGKVSRAEYVAHFMAGFERKDKNKNGTLEPTEHAHPSFARADLNKDNQLTREEFQSIFDRQFNRLDNDQDEFISVDDEAK